MGIKGIEVPNTPRVHESDYARQFSALKQAFESFIHQQCKFHQALIESGSLDPDVIELLSIQTSNLMNVGYQLEDAISAISSNHQSASNPSLSKQSLSDDIIH